MRTLPPTLRRPWRTWVSNSSAGTVREILATVAWEVSTSSFNGARPGCGRRWAGERWKEVGRGAPIGRAGDSSGDSGGRPRGPGRFRVRGVIRPEQGRRLNRGRAQRSTPREPLRVRGAPERRFEARDRPPRRPDHRSTEPMLRKLLHATVQRTPPRRGPPGSVGRGGRAPGTGEQELPGPRPVPVRDGPAGGTGRPQGPLGDRHPEGGSRGEPRARARGPCRGGRRRPRRRRGAAGGDLLVQLDPAPTELELDAERTALRLARVRLETARQTLASALRAATLARSSSSSCEPTRSAGVGWSRARRAERTRLDLLDARAPRRTGRPRGRAARLEERERRGRRRRTGGGARGPADRAAGGPTRPARGPRSLRRRVRALPGRLCAACPRSARC